MWQESDNPDQLAPASMTDVVFRISCVRLPVDHAAVLAAAVCAHAPLLGKSSRAGVHPIHVAGSQNGWERPDREGQPLLLSRRTRLKIRIDVTDANTLIDLLSGVSLDVDGFPLHILSGQTRALQPAPTLLSRYTIYHGPEAPSDEAGFVEQVAKQCSTLGFTSTKVLCGREQQVKTRDGDLLTRSVLLADVPPAHSLALQDHGLGDGRTFGCGLLIPHKDTNAVNQTSDSFR